LDGCPDQAAPKSEGGCPPIHIVAKAIDEEIDRNEVYGLPASTSLVSKEVTPVVVPDPAPPTNYTAMRTPVDNAQVTEDDLKRLKEISQILRYKPKSAQLDPTSTSYIGEIQQIISKYPNHKLVITGYYGEDSDEEENKILSVTRAFEIKKQLLFTQNQAFSKIESDGFGSEKVGRGKGRGMIEFQLVPKK
jgi:outer membrane protein OmpA-like peptidoglycan-associated protein